MEWVRKEQEQGAIVLPCHDPEVLEKYPYGEKGVAKIS
jgi:hypothetical protein